MFIYKSLVYKFLNVTYWTNLFLLTSTKFLDRHTYKDNIVWSKEDFDIMARGKCPSRYRASFFMELSLDTV